MAVWTTPTSYVSGQVLTAAGLNVQLRDNMQFVHDQGIVICTTPTRPAAPWEGMYIYDLTVHGLLQYTTPVTGWRPPWNLPWGVLAVGVDTTPRDSAINSGAATVVFPTLNFTPVSGRYYKVSYHAINVVWGGPGALFTALADQAGVTQQNVSIEQGFTATNMGITAVIAAAWTTGSLTGLQIKATSSGASPVTFQQGTYGAYLIIEDFGPSSAPP